MSNNIWFKNPRILFEKHNLIPNSTMNFDEQMNSLTRLIFLSFLLILLFTKFSFSLIYLLISVGIILFISIYYSQTNKENMSNKVVENFMIPGFPKLPNRDVSKHGKNYSSGSSVLQNRGRNEIKIRDFAHQPEYSSSQVENTNLRWSKSESENCDYPQRAVFCDKFEEMNFGPTFYSKNQSLVGPPNPRTNTSVISVAPSHDLDFWRANNMITHSHVNREKQEDLYLSGQVSTTCCGVLGDSYLVPSGGNTDIKNGVGQWSRILEEEGRKKGREKGIPDYGDDQLCWSSRDPEISQQSWESRDPEVEENDTPYYKEEDQFGHFIVKEEEVYENFCQGGSCGNIRTNSPRIQRGIPYSGRPVNEEREKTFSNTEILRKPQNKPNQKDVYGQVYNEIPGMVNMQCGYNPDQLFNSNLPVNFAAGNCEQSPNLASYNKNIFTQTIQPGVYTVNDVIEPINSNIGISYDQQFLPVSCKFTENGGTLYTQHDPNLVDIVRKDDRQSVKQAVDNANIYDPRHSGYGTSYRSYTDETTGQTRFAYDDINAIRMPNYITRSHIDFEPYADSYGPMKTGQSLGNEFNSDIRALAQDSWLRNSLQFRNDLSERRMRKINADAWQQRVAPIHTRGMPRK
jgi:hypothetical protein